MITHDIAVSDNTVVEAIADHRQQVIVVTQYDEDLSPIRFTRFALTPKGAQGAKRCFFEWSHS